MTPKQLDYFRTRVYRGLTGEQRFWKRVAIKGPDECWEWQGPCNGSGYGNIGFTDLSTTTHRISYELANGAVGNTYTVCILHRCDNPPCCNPAHLFIGTRADNIADMTQKGRLASFEGTKNVRALLTESQVLVIRDSDKTNVELGREYGVGPTTISAIRTGRNWQHLTDKTEENENGNV